MKNKRIILIIVIAIILLIVGVIFIMNRKVYNINLPELKNVASITIEKNGEVIMLSGKEEVEQIFLIIKGEERKTTTKSVDNIPTDKDEVIKVDINFESSTATVVYVYMDNNKYYIEQPMNGIYEIDYEDYQIINGYTLN